MSKIVFWLWLAVAFTSCNGQEKVEVSITNRSPSKIDSVVFPFVRGGLEGLIHPSQTKTAAIYVASEQLHHDGSFPVYIHQNGKSFRADYAFHGMGQLASKNYRFYFFENGISTKDTPLQQPQEFTLFVVDQSAVPADSIGVRPASLIRLANLEKSIEIVVNFEKFSKNPILEVSRNGSTSYLRLNRGWSNWNITQEVIYINESGMVPGK